MPERLTPSAPSARITAAEERTKARACAHTVRFFEDDDAWARALVAFVTEGVAAGERVVLIVTARRGRLLDAAVRAAGLDVSTLVEHGQLILIEAEALLARFTVQGHPDRTSFRECMQELLTPLTDSPLRAYGEMVDVLWQSGNQPGAIALERFWRELQLEHRFDLLCGYDLRAVSGTFEIARISEEHDDESLPRPSGAALERGTPHHELLHELARDLGRAQTQEEVFTAAARALSLGLDACAAFVLPLSDGGLQVHATEPLTREERAALTADMSVPHALGSRYVTASFELGEDARHFGKLALIQRHGSEPAAAELATARAIADQVAAALRYFGSRDEAQRTRRSSEVFLAMLGHDLRNPLGAIRVMAEQLQRTAGEDASGPAARIVKSSIRMSRMVDQLLEFARLRVMGGVPLTPARTDLAVVLRHAAEELEPLYPWLRFSLDCVGDASGEWDADRLSQVFSNLIGNAAQHGTGSEPVQLRVEGSAAETVTVEIQSHGGFEQDLLPSMFEPLSNAEHVREGARSSGLGLFISRELVRAHGGELTVSCQEPAEFTTCRITLPRGAR